MFGGKDKTVSRQSHTLVIWKMRALLPQPLYYGAYMTCVCGSDRIITAGGKCSDMGWVMYGDEDHDGYIPSHIGIGGSDYIDFKYCADCGRIQSSVFPLPQDLKIVEDDEE